MNREAGFSLIELMCAILILGIGIVGITHGITTGLSASKDSEGQTSAALLAAGRIETARAEGYYEAGDSQGEFEGDLSAYRWQQSITKTDLDGLFNLKVTIESAKTGREIYSLETLVFEPPLESSSGSSTKSPGSQSRKKQRRNL